METEVEPTLRTFVIADVRGYTRFTREHGDAAAARLAKRFADLARDAVEARGGRVIELRGDEALAVFESSAQAVRAAVEFQATCVEDTAADPSLPLTVGIGIDAGEAIPVEDGFRGVALNMAARLCSRALAGQVLVTRAIADAAEGVDGIALEDVGLAELKGFETPVEVTAVVPTRAPLADVRRVPPTEVPPELDRVSPLVARDRQMHWLRGTWRQARRGRGRVVILSGPSQIGKTRLAAELAAEVADGGGDVVYAGPGGAATALAISSIRDAMQTSEPRLVVLDDLDVAGEDAARTLLDAMDQLVERPVMFVATVQDPAAGPALASVVEAADAFGDGHLRVPALTLDGARGIAHLYVGDDVEPVPLESMLRATGGVAGRLHEVVSEWTRDEAGRRLTAAAEWLAQGRDRRSADLAFANNAIGLGLAKLYESPPTAGSETVCPYKGLASFEESDARSFFGRERLVGELAARTVGVGLLGVVGASGSGKSSVIAGGLIPSLRAGLLPGSDRWRTARFRPGERPTEELERALGSPLADTIAATEDRLVVAVDQFEEVFTLADEEERARFIATLTDAATSSPDRVLVLLTVRDDFYGHCAPYRALADLLVANHVLVAPMTVEELRRAIELPARRARLRVEGGLVDALVAEVIDEPGGLPLLSAALVELWQAREDAWLRLESYERTGGVRGAVARLAEASYEQLTPEEREAAKRLFLRLASVGDGDVVTRRRVETAELELHADAVTARVVDRLTSDRLLTATGSSVEVAHEALLREWPRLRSWLDDDLQGHRLRQHLTAAARQWDASDREPSELYRGARLTGALDWASTHGADLNELERTFVAESRGASERETERQRRTNRRLRGLLVGTAVFLVLALVAGGLALVQRGRAEDQATRAERAAARAEREARVASARELAGAAVTNLDVDPELAMLLALESVEATLRAGGPVVPEAEEALHRAIMSRVVGSVPEGELVAVAPPDGALFATIAGGGATVWDAETLERVVTLRAGSDPSLSGIAFDPAGRRLATTGEAGRLRVWDVSAGELVYEIDVDEPMWGVAFDATGERVAATLRNGSVVVWDAATGRELQTLRGPEELPFSSGGTSPTPVFSPDGTMLASGGWGYNGIVWDLGSGEIEAVLEGHVWEVSDIGFSPDGKLVATTGPDGTVRLWDTTTWSSSKTFAGTTADQYALAFSPPDGSRIATGGADGTAVVWDTDTGEQLMRLAGHGAAIFGVAFTPDGSTLLTSSDDATTRLWDVTLEGEREWLTVRGPAVRLGGVEFSPDGSTFAVPMAASGVRIHDTETGEVVMDLTGHGAPLWDLAFSPEGRLLAGSPGAGPASATGDAMTVPVWELASGELVGVLDGHQKQVSAVEFHPSGERIVTAGYDGVLRVWRTGSWEEPSEELAAGKAPYAFEFSPDGRYLFAGFGLDGYLSILDGTTFQNVATINAHPDGIQDVALIGNARVVSAGFDATARVWDVPPETDVHEQEAVYTLRGHTGGLLSVAVSPDRSLVATAGTDGLVKLWDAQTGAELMTLFGHDQVVHTVTFSPDGRFIASASVDGTVMLRLVHVEDLVELARERVTRELTDAECQRYLHVATCPPG